MGALSYKLRDASFYGILDTGYVSRENMFGKCRALIDAGAKIIQLRAKYENRAERESIAREILPLFAEKNSPIFVINDDAELAASLPDTGLHVGQDDISPLDARRILGEGRVLGLSTHSREQAAYAQEIAETIDYFAVGPIYPTNTKKGRPAVGLQLVEWVANYLKPQLPWFAIGGVNLNTAAAVRRAGAERIVAVSDVLMPDDTRAAVAALMQNFSA